MHVVKFRPKLNLGRIRPQTNVRAAISLRLPFPPSTNNLFFNAGQRRVITGKYEQWRKDSHASLIEQFRYKFPFLGGPIEITLTLEDRPGRRDLDNLCKAVLDFLVSQSIIEGDHNKIVRKITLQWGENAGVDVEITPSIHRRAA